MFVFVLYAMGIWYAAALYRRRVGGYLWVGGGILGLLVVAYFHHLLNLYTGGKIYLPVLASLLWPYTALVLAVGVYIASLPRRAVPCRRCGHDLASGGSLERVCSGCGLPRPYRAHGPRCAVCKYDLTGQDEDDGICPECGTHYFDRRAKRVRHDPIRGPQPYDELRPPSSVPQPVALSEAATEANRDDRRRDLLRDLSSSARPS